MGLLNDTTSETLNNNSLQSSGDNTHESSQTSSALLNNSSTTNNTSPVQFPKPLIDESQDISTPSQSALTGNNSKNQEQNDNNPSQSSLQSNTNSTNNKPSKNQNKAKSETISAMIYNWVDDNVTEDINNSLSDSISSIINGVFNTPYKVLLPVVYDLKYSKDKLHHYLGAWGIVGGVSLALNILLWAITSFHNPVPWFIAIGINTVIMLLLVTLSNPDSKLSTMMVSKRKIPGADRPSVVSPEDSEEDLLDVDNVDTTVDTVDNTSNLKPLTDSEITSNLETIEEDDIEFDVDTELNNTGESNKVVEESSDTKIELDEIDISNDLDSDISLKDIGSEVPSSNVEQEIPKIFKQKDKPSAEHILDSNDAKVVDDNIPCEELKVLLGKPIDFDSINPAEMLDSVDDVIAMLNEDMEMDDLEGHDHYY